jgi:hypothetical protein
VDEDHEPDAMDSWQEIQGELEFGNYWKSSTYKSAPRRAT